MAKDDIDFTSDLNGTGDTTFSVNEGSVSAHGADAVDVNNQRPARPAVADTPAPADAPSKPLSIRDQISSSLKGEGNTPDAATIETVRDPVTGQFAPKPADVQTASEPAAAPVVAAPQGIDPAVFQALPAETQVSLARTMDDLNNRHQRLASLEQVEQLVAPRRQAWALNGMTEAQALNQLLALSDFATRDTGAFIQYIAQQNGVDLEALVLGAEPVDPKYATLEQQIQQLQQERMREQEQRLQAAHQQTVQSVQAFATEKGPDGQPLRPYFDDLGTGVLPFISAVKAENPNMTPNQVLQEAYDRACWGTPTVRAKMQAAATAASEAERLRTQADRASRARSASASVPSGAPASAPAAPNDPSRSVRDTIRASIAQVSAG